MRGTYLLVMGWDFTGIGGVTQVVSSLYRNIAALSSMDPRLLVLSWREPRPTEEIDPQGRAISRYRVRPPFASGPLALDLARFLIRAPYELWQLRRLLRKHNVRVVNYHFVHAVTVTWVLARCLGIYRGKVAFSFHGLDLRTLSALTGWRRRAIRWALARADLLIACSEGLARELITDLKLPGTNVAVIHNGVDVARLEQVAASSAAPPMPVDADPLVLSLGTFEHKKGHDLLLRAFAEVVAVYPNATLVLLGRSGPTKPATEALARELGLEKRVVLHADVGHGAALAALRRADVFVLPSRNEAFSVALLEAGAFARPVVATDVCGVAELIKDGETGVLVPPEDARALSSGLLRILRDRAKAGEYGARLRDIVLSRFTEQETALQYLRSLGCLETVQAAMANEEAR